MSVSVKANLGCDPFSKKGISNFGRFAFALLWNSCRVKYLTFYIRPRQLLSYVKTERELHPLLFYRSENVHKFLLLSIVSDGNDLKSFVLTLAIVTSKLSYKIK